MMRSLGLKLTLAFLTVGILGVALVAIIVGQRTIREFDQFVNDRFQRDLVNQLTDYYEHNGSWLGLTQEGNRRTHLRINRFRMENVDITLLDAEQKVIFSNRPRGAHEPFPSTWSYKEVALQVQNQTVGWLRINVPPDAERLVPDSPELAFLDRVRQATIASAVAASLLAIVLGWLLARAISKPVRELTAATQAVAKGQLGQQVVVRSKDEIGQLAHSFNQMSADLAHATQIRRQMTADIAHDLRTPLSVILGYTEALNDGKLPGDAEIYETLHSEAKHLNHLIDDLRILSLADANELPLSIVPLHPRDILERAAAAHQMRAQQAEISLTVDVAPNLPKIQVDPERMAQVMGNLVSNAMRYTPDGGTIQLKAGRQDDVTTLRIQDSGSGIHPDELPHIFDRFYRGDKSRQSSGESGLGLAIAKSIVEAHGGAISVESTPDRGSTFTLTMPSSAQLQHGRNQ